MEKYCKFYTTTDQLKEEDILAQKHLKLGKKIGAGGYGIVYMIEQSNDTQLYACKVIDLNENLRRHFQNELVAMLSCPKHRNVIQMVQVLVIDQKAFIVMEYANGGTISELIAKNRPLKEDLAGKVFVF